MTTTTTDPAAEKLAAAVPPPDEIKRGIAEKKEELAHLRRLLRISASIARLRTKIGEAAHAS